MTRSTENSPGEPKLPRFDLLLLAKGYTAAH
jgi:hypothetical protein